MNATSCGPVGLVMDWCMSTCLFPPGPEVEKGIGVETLVMQLKVTITHCVYNASM
jgi:hypothetical protein